MAQLVDPRERENPFGDLRCNGCRRLAVVAEEVADRLVGHVRPALGIDHVPHRLRRHELRDGGDDDRVAHLGAHAADLLERCVEQLGPPQLVEHPARRRDHAPGELMPVVRRVELLRRPDGEPALAPDRAEVLCHGRERVEVEPMRVALRLEVAQRRLDGRVRRAPRQRRDGGVQHLEPRAQPFHVDERREPDRAVAVQLDRPFARRREEVRRQLAHGVRRQAAHPGP